MSEKATLRFETKADQPDGRDRAKESRDLILSSPLEESESDSQTITKYRPKTARPSLYRVILLNDDFTPMDFVVHILKKFFNKPESEANRLMLQVHSQGSATAGVFSFEIAETKVYLVNEYAKGHKHPLKCVMEKDPS